MNSWSKILTLVLLATAFAASGAIPKNTFEELQQAELLNESGKYAEAKARFAALLKSIPPSNREARAWAYFGHAYASDNLSSTVETDIETLQAIADEYLLAAELDEKYYQGAANFNAGLLLRKLGKKRQALDAFLLSTKSNHPERVRFLYETGREYESLGMLEEATETQRQVLKQEPEREDARKALLTLYARRGMDEPAVDLATSWSSSSRNLAYVNYTLTTMLTRKRPAMNEVLAETALLTVAYNHARLYLSSADFENSVYLDYAKAQSIHPHLAGPIEALRTAYAVAQTERRYFEGPNSGWWHESEERRRVWSSILKSIGNNRWNAGQYASAESYYEAAIGYRVPYEMQSWVDLDAVVMVAGVSNITNRIETLQQLVPAVDRWVEIHPARNDWQKTAYRDFYFYAAWSYGMAYDNARSIELNKKSLEFDPDFANAHVNLGYIYMGTLNLPDAIRHFERAVELDDTNPTANNNLGFVTLIYGDFDKAVHYLSRAYELDNYLLVTVNLGDAYRYAGDAERALQFHREAMKGIRERGTDENYMATRWRYNYMPLYRGDTDTINNSIPVNTVDEKRAFVHFALSFDQALLGQFEAAQQNFNSALGYAGQPEFRCFFANKIAAIDVFVKIPPASVDWFDARKRELKQGLPCEGS